MDGSCLLDEFSEPLLLGSGQDWAAALKVPINTMLQYAIAFFCISKHLSLT